MLSALLFATVISKGRGSDGNLEKVKGFLKDVADDKGHFDAIIRDHICAIDDQKKEERLSLLRQQLASLREELRSLPAGGSYSIKNYADLVSDKQDLLIEEGQKKNIYRIESNGTFICLVWVNEGKIASFSTMNKGDKRVFLKICT